MRDRFLPTRLRPGVLAILVSAPALAACELNVAPSTPVEVRVENATDQAFEVVTVHFPRGSVEFGRVDPWSRTEYREVELAYEHAPVDVQVNGATRSVVVVDYVGEAPLEGGRYTYVLRIRESDGTLDLELRSDG